MRRPLSLETHEFAGAGEISGSATRALPGSAGQEDPAPAERRLSHPRLDALPPSLMISPGWQSSLRLDEVNVDSRRGVGCGIVGPSCQTAVPKGVRVCMESGMPVLRLFCWRVLGGSGVKGFRSYHADPALLDSARSTTRPMQAGEPLQVQVCSLGAACSSLPPPNLRHIL
jgi:hypothetical protein